MVAGGPVRGSWWSHPRGGRMFRVLCELEDRRDVLATKLVDGKVTFVHRRLWPAVLGAASAAETRGLSRAARALLRRVRRGGLLQASGDAARELERRLLVHATEVHTESGAHARALQTWDRWRVRSKWRGRAMRPADARAALEAAAPGARFPWS